MIAAITVTQVTRTDEIDFAGCRIVLGGKDWAPGTGPVYKDGIRIGEIATLHEVPVFIPQF